MQVVCVRPFGLHEPGDVAEVPDGAAFDPEHWAEVPETPPEPPSPAAPAVFPVATQTEM